MAAVVHKPTPQQAQGEFHSNYGERMRDLVQSFNEVKADPAQTDAAKKHAQKALHALDRSAAKINYVVERMSKNTGNALNVLSWSMPLVEGDFRQLEIELEKIAPAKAAANKARAKTRSAAKAAAQARADQLRAGQPATTAMGIWSLNPNLWGLTQEQANEYLAAQAQAELDRAKLAAELKVTTAQADAQAEQISPTISGTLSGAARGGINTMATTYTVLWLAAVAALGVWGYSEFVGFKKTLSRK